MAVLLGARIHLPQPHRWRDLTPAAIAAVRSIEGAKLAGHRILRAEWSTEECHFSVTGEYLIVNATLTVDGKPPAADIVGVYDIGAGTMHVTDVTPLPAPTAVVLDRLEGDAEAETRERLGLDRPHRHCVALSPDLVRAKVQ